MERLDRAVVDHLEWRLLDPQRLAKMMDQLLERREEWNERRRGHITELRKRSAEAEAKLKRIYEAIETAWSTSPTRRSRIALLS
jgi:plasmid stabilization system protein ParE